ncbi:MAG: exo-alpha-sialidase [Lentisphaerae bacterium]|nr:exo-alpha-sialidase [Lentisphaerota bacterium]MBT4821053.1 exo-alpha-sialidase [Lentisphaerota bacterium]MBT5612261.1 exo-alpha-sialidase [Lentisphaerota bacterium]MBT7060761.1 exo-alpha-sialidase [Lentisphaerota bacterium]MBT7845240.1 exo-alpha-sialidase [Lentisphaerota bacterium]
MEFKRMLTASSLVVATSMAHASPTPPVMLFQGEPIADSGAASGAHTAYAIMRLPGGEFAFYNRYAPQAGPLVLPDADGRKHTLLPHLPPQIAASEIITGSKKLLANTQVILTPDNGVKSVYVKGEKLDRETARKVGLPRYLDVWISQASPTHASEPMMIWRGYNGSQMEYQQLPNGRIIVPYGSFQPHARAVPPTGRHKTIIQYSDDDGQSWTESDSKLVSPCYPGFNGSNEGACEPAFEQLADGRIWMLMRTQAGFLYESCSDDNGTTWRKARASRFNTSTGPPNIMRHRNGWLVVCWNNCEMPPRCAGEGVYGGRDALHIAVSDDEGATWRGFREIYLDHRRNDNPTRSGDRGTAYPLGAYTADGKIVVLSGQGAGGRNPILIDPEWIVETEAQTDFSDGLRQWSVYKHYGPAKRWWRARAVGCELVANPAQPDTRSLHIRKADALPADGATWNFPNGSQGSLTARVMMRKGCQGGLICLNDRFFDPANDHGDAFAVCRIELGADGRVGTAVLEFDRWHDITLSWNLAIPECHLLVDGADAGAVKIRNETLNGISYVRFRSTAKALDVAGFLVDSVKVTLDAPHAPPCGPEDQVRQEARYVDQMVPLWSEGQ